MILIFGTLSWTFIRNNFLKFKLMSKSKVMLIKIQIQSSFLINRFGPQISLQLSKIKIIFLPYYISIFKCNCRWYRWRNLQIIRNNGGWLHFVAFVKWYRFHGQVISKWFFTLSASYFHPYKNNISLELIK